LIGGKDEGVALASKNSDRIDCQRLDVNSVNFDDSLKIISMNDHVRPLIAAYNYQGVTIDREYVIWITRNRHEAEAIPQQRDDINDGQRRGRASRIPALTINEGRISGRYDPG